MRRGSREVVAHTLPVRPQYRKEPSVKEQKRKCRPQTSRKPTEKKFETHYPCKITIETASFSRYYPRNNLGKSR